MIKVSANRQEIFDKVAAHLLAQKQKSTDAFGMCSYRGDDELMCAAGCLIPDEEYSYKLEGKTWINLVCSCHASGTNEILVSALQNLHDDYDASSWLEQLYWLAIRHGLSTEKLPALST
jgi:hypothetical protein